MGFILSQAIIHKYRLGLFVGTLAFASFSPLLQAFLFGPTVFAGFFSLVNFDPWSGVIFPIFLRQEDNFALPFNILE